MSTILSAIRVGSEVNKAHWSVGGCSAIKVETSFSESVASTVIPVHNGTAD